MLELVTGLLSLFAVLKYGLGIPLIFIILEVATIISIGYIDLSSGYIYNLDVFILFVTEFISKIYFGEDFFVPFKLALVLGVIFFLIYFFTGMMGLGDVIYSAAIGFICKSFYEVLLFFNISFISAAIVSVVLIILKKKKIKDSISFGPYMSLATLAILFLRWIMFEENCIIKIKDGFFHYINLKSNDKSKKFYIPYSIYRDGVILNYHHFFYKFKKMIEEIDLKRSLKLIILLESSLFKHFNFEIPKIEENEIENFLKIELEDYPNIDLSEYEIFYKKVENSSKLLLSVDLIGKNIINSFKDILTKLDIKNFLILPEMQIYSKNGTYFDVGTHYVRKIEVKDNLVFSVKKVYNENLEDLIYKNKLETKNVENILNRKYDPEENRIDEDFLFKYENYFLNYLYLFKSSDDKAYIVGDLVDSMPISKIKEFTNMELSDGNSEVNYNFNIKRHRKNSFKSEKLFNYILPLGLVIILAGNLIYVNSLNKNINELEKDNEKIRPVVQDVSSDKYQRDNKNFVKIIGDVQALEDSDFVITKYLFDNGDISISGVVKDESYLDKKFKDYKITYKNMYIEDGFNKFEIKLKSN